MMAMILLRRHRQAYEPKKPAVMEFMGGFVNTINMDVYILTLDVYGNIYNKNENILTIIGYDGGVAIYDKSSGPKFWKWGQYYMLTELEENTTFVHFRASGENPNREMQGQVVIDPLVK